MTREQIEQAARDYPWGSPTGPSLKDIINFALAQVEKATELRVALHEREQRLLMLDKLARDADCLAREECARIAESNIDSKGNPITGWVNRTAEEWHGHRIAQAIRATIKP